ncbi:trehalose 6-phosphate synthase/phosphatase [Acetomicrobium thermoterrenum DSM 13490]|uniref:Alpha,alpha-trehalose-phosphate synthase n=1 Tax=Acetomicrobium thermoterrenum DSM 13490 TaxID=1120987 RepID=A0A1H3F2P4_9BACT|nr:bifunctional alpha,alpha-trehalose-phosphate synthase (UDP-forming)/trehalose-phosphatase [Acetomicrobium thermoterrenum]SDX84474.1 trehalose 6-phosphate synthase/phosphatase [Acetomicrobium thermoterrenum DSM 13490]
MNHKRLIIASNRLPFTVEEDDKGDLKLKASAGGLVTGLSAYLDSLQHSSFTEGNEYVWLGWPGASISDEHKEHIKQIAESQFNAYPVFMEEETMDAFYHGFCNKTIWPLFHYFPTYVVYEKESWESYKEVNEHFCETIMEILRPDDILWIHDYHLMLLPRLIRQRMSEVSIGFFLHIPFPSYELFRLLPKNWAKEILQGLLGADVIGFHTHDYTQYFLRSTLRLLGYENNMGKMFIDHRLVKADTFPMGIDFYRFNNAVNSRETQIEREKLQNILSGLKTIVSVDRLDYSKGLLNRLEGYKLFLANNPQWHGKVTLLLVVVPSRIGVDRYQAIKTKIDQMVGNINGAYSTLNWVPINYKYGHVPFHQLVALYSVSDVALITPLRDGMNLVSKEYVASRKDMAGVLILSELAGASKELGEAILINPNDREEIAASIKEALEMPVEEQQNRLERMQQRLKNYHVVKWASEFIQELDYIKDEQRRFQTKILDKRATAKMLDEFEKANHCIFFLDYDGTLVPFSGDPKKAIPPRELLDLLRELSKINKVDIVIISGRERSILQQWLGDLDINFVAEHGVWIKEKGKDWELLRHASSEWKKDVLSLLKHYVDKVPGSFLEEKEYSVSWHFRKADPEQAADAARELTDLLLQYTANTDAQIIQGRKVIEVRNAGIDKGKAALYFLSKKNYDFVLAIGDDRTDEDFFRSLSTQAWTVKVGMTHSNARSNVMSYKDVRNLLDMLKNRARGEV